MVRRALGKRVGMGLWLERSVLQAVASGCWERMWWMGNQAELREDIACTVPVLQISVFMMAVGGGEDAEGA